MSICQYWDCDERIRTGYFLCSAHYKGREEGLVDECPECDRYKDAEYELCLECHKRTRQRARSSSGDTTSRARRTSSKRSGTVAERKRTYKTEASDRWAANDEGIDEFYVYILRLREGGFYVGHTRDLRARVMEHKDGQVPSTKGRDPKLAWFATGQSRVVVATHEAELKSLVKRNERAIRNMIIKFQDLVGEVED